MGITTFLSRTEAETKAIAGELAATLKIGDVVMLSGNLGAGKTVFARGVLEALGWTGAVRSPTFNLLQVYETVPPVVHCDLYRVASALGLGLEDYLDDHVLLVEWPERAGAFFEGGSQIRVDIDAAEDFRRIVIRRA